jgi:chemotaxis protein methyltransferase CheR
MKQVLTVDDSATVRQMVSFTLRNAGYGVTEAGDGKQGRKLVEFRRLNFMDSDYRLAEKMDAVFCRNVIIYFDRPTQEKILRRLSSYLKPGGYLFVGHSETLHDMNLPLEALGPALYRRVDGRC